MKKKASEGEMREELSAVAAETFETDHLRFQREYYDRHFARRAAAIREQVNHPLFGAFYDRLAAEILSASPTRPLRVFEPGCGEGLLAAALRRESERRGIDLAYTGSDVSESATDVARELAGGEYIVGDATEVTAALQPGSFDVLIAKNLLHHLDDPTEFLAAASRAVGADGRVVICEAKLGANQNLVFGALAYQRERYFFKGWERNFGKPVAAAGLKVLSARPFDWFPYELLFAIRFDWFRKLIKTANPRVLDKTLALDETLARRLPWFTTYVLAVTQPG
jgi:SAM-dependent methyltransferase